MKTVTLKDAMSLKTLKGYYIAKAAHYSILKTLYFMSLIWQRNIFARNGWVSKEVSKEGNSM